MDLHLNIWPYLASVAGAAIAAGGIVGWLDLLLIGRSRRASAPAAPVIEQGDRDAGGDRQAA